MKRLERAHVRIEHAIIRDSIDKSSENPMEETHEALNRVEARRLVHPPPTLRVTPSSARRQTENGVSVATDDVAAR
jgi:hypothetical protein